MAYSGSNAQFDLFLFFIFISYSKGEQNWNKTREQSDKNNSTMCADSFSYVPVVFLIIKHFSLHALSFV